MPPDNLRARSADMAETRSPGFFGKMPSRGDFVSRRLSASFVDPWDAWLQSALATSRNSLGSQWLDIYLTSPVWRFALSPGVCGDEGHVGVVIPSVDKVGRYFPLTAALPTGRRSALGLALELAEWYATVEELMLATLAETPLDLEAFDRQLAQLTVAPSSTLVGGERVWTRANGGAVHWHCDVPAASGLCESLVPQLAQFFGDGVGPCAFWWTQGSERIAPCTLITPALPDSDAFGAMLDGSWDLRGWSSGEIQRARGAAAPPRFHARSAAVSHPGKARTINEDAYAQRDALGVWIVADGLGGHAAGDVASGMVTSVIDELGDARSLAERVDALGRVLRVVNGCLRVLARDSAADLTASTVAGLAIVGEESASLWAGDSRIYRLRVGELQQLSRDHSDVGPDSPADRAVTRAVGGAQDLHLDVQQGDVRDGDRFLLCTDGLYAEVGDDDIVAALSLAEPEQACARLKDLALRGDARDNLTAVVVFVESPAPGAAQTVWP